jgi:hypothetical protein
VVVVIARNLDCERRAEPNGLEVVVKDLWMRGGRTMKMLGRQRAAGQQRKAEYRDREVAQRPHAAILPDLPPPASSAMPRAGAPLSMEAAQPGDA